MKYADLALPVPYHKTMDILDSSKIQTFMRSPRLFFYQYVLGWRPEEPNIHLAFGSAWHDVMEFLKLHQDGQTLGYPGDVMLAAVDLFLESYDKYYPEGLMGGLSPDIPDNKTKANGVQAIVDYTSHYSTDRFKTLYTEVAGTAPVGVDPYDGQDRLIHFKLDTIIEDERGIWSLEHKTASRNDARWRAQWSVIPQIGTYSHVLWCLFGEEAQGVKVNGAILRYPTKSTGKSNNDFIRIPVRKSKKMMVGWLGQINQAWDLIDWNMKQLESFTSEDESLDCFTCQPFGCQLYGPCPFADFCSTWPNPLKHAQKPPHGFKQEFWDPSDSDSEAKAIVEIKEGRGIITPKEVAK